MRGGLDKTLIQASRTKQHTVSQMPISFKVKPSNYILFLMRTLHHLNNLQGQDLVTMKLCTFKHSRDQGHMCTFVLSGKSFYKYKYKGQSVSTSLITTSLVNILFMPLHFFLSLCWYSYSKHWNTTHQEVVTYPKELSQYFSESIKGSCENHCQNLNILFTHPMSSNYLWHEPLAQTNRNACINIWITITVWKSQWNNIWKVQLPYFLTSNLRKIKSLIRGHILIKSVYHTSNNNH